MTSRSQLYSEVPLHGSLSQDRGLLGSVGSVASDLRGRVLGESLPLRGLRGLRS